MSQKKENKTEKQCIVAQFYFLPHPIAPQYKAGALQGHQMEHLNILVVENGFYGHWREGKTLGEALKLPKTPSIILFIL